MSRAHRPVCGPGHQRGPFCEERAHPGADGACELGPQTRRERNELGRARRPARPFENLHRINGEDAGLAARDSVDEGSVLVVIPDGDPVSILLDRPDGVEVVQAADDRVGVPLQIVAEPSFLRTARVREGSPETGRVAPGRHPEPEIGRERPGVHTSLVRPAKRRSPAAHILSPPGVRLLFESSVRHASSSPSS